MGLDEAMAALEPMCNTAQECIVFCISEQMSTTANVFRMAAEELKMTEQVSVIDSENLSTGIGLLVLKAATMIKEGKSRAEICTKIEQQKPKVRASFVVDTLVYLHRGGRCSSVAAFAGGMLKLHPKIVVKDGAMDASKKYRGKMDKVILEYVKEMESDMKMAEKERIFITHSGCSEETIRQVYAYLEQMNCFEEILVTKAGGVISSHCGPGTLGVLYVMQ